MYNIMCPADNMHLFFLSKECIPTYSAPAWSAIGKAIHVCHETK